MTGRERQLGASSPGPAADPYLPLDPTRNVLDLVTAAIGRQDDLRELESKYLRS
jgi:hypothetical protein